LESFNSTQSKLCLFDNYLIMSQIEKVK